MFAGDAVAVVCCTQQWVSLCVAVCHREEDACNWCQYVLLCDTGKRVHVLLARLSLSLELVMTHIGERKHKNTAAVLRDKNSRTSLSVCFRNELRSAS